MTIKAPLTWKPENYRRFVKMETAGLQAVTHLAQLQSPEGKVCRAYVKHYPPTHARGLFNEWFGHIVFGALGVPQQQRYVRAFQLLGFPALQVSLVFCF